MNEVEKIIKIAEKIKDKYDIEEVLIDISIINKVMFGNYTESSKVEIYNEIRNKYFEEIKRKVDYQKWMCGHYHDNMQLPGGKDLLLYEQIIRII